MGGLFMPQLASLGQLLGACMGAAQAGVLHLHLALHALARTGGVSAPMLHFTLGGCGPTRTSLSRMIRAAACVLGAQG